MSEHADDSFDANTWAVFGVVCGLIIGQTDDSLASALLWSTGSIVFGERILPALVRRAERVLERQGRGGFFLGVCFGWGLVPGPLVGSLFGALAPTLWELPVTSLQGACLGLVLGPIAAMAQGLITAVLVLGIVKLATGRNLAAD